MCRHADDTTFHACDSDLKDLIPRFKHDSLQTIEWFQANSMKLNKEKCHLLIPGHKHELLWANIGWSKTWEYGKQKLLGIVIHRNLRFDEYILSQCKKSGRKLSVLVRICISLVIALLHERALKIVYNDNVSWFENLLQSDQSVSIHHKNIRLLGIELYKTDYNYLNNEI